MAKIVYVVIPNWNGEERLAEAVDSVLAQSFANFDLIIVDNGSTDGSRKIMEAYAAKDSRVRNIFRDKNYGYTGGVNPGLELALEEQAQFVAPFNNDAVADKDWLKHLVNFLRTNTEVGIATCSLKSMDGKIYDSTGDLYTIWGLPYPRGRDEPVRGQYDHDTHVFGASGGASMFRVKSLQHVGIFDQDFFAYYEDIDLSWRHQLAGWKVAFVPKSVVYHEHGSTSSGMRGFTTYQTIKNYPLILIKDVPARFLPTMLPRFLLAYLLFIGRAFTRGHGWWAIKAFVRMIWLVPKKIGERYHIQKTRVVSNKYIASILTHDLPPNAYKLRTIRKRVRTLTFRKTR